MCAHHLCNLSVCDVEGGFSELPRTHDYLALPPGCHVGHHCSRHRQQAVRVHVKRLHWLSAADKLKRLQNALR